MIPLDLKTYSMCMQQLHTNTKDIIRSKVTKLHKTAKFCQALCAHLEYDMLDTED